jgi:predicted transcriptional regulator
MAETTTITVRIPVELKDRLDRLANVTRRSRSYLASEALNQYLAEELEVVEGILRGIADAEAGRVTPHEQAMAELREIVESARRRPSKKSA